MMEYKEILQEIESGLTGDPNKDLKYLHKQLEKYQSHHNAHEISRALARFILDLLPSDEKEKINRPIEECYKEITVLTNTVNEKIFNGKIDEAMELFSGILPYIELMEMAFKTDKPGIVTEHLVFEDILQYYFYLAKFQPVQEIRNPGGPNLSEIYFQYIYLLVEKKEFQKALKVIDAALKWNPLSAKILFEKAEIFKMQNNLQAFLDITLECIKVAYMPVHIAQYFRNLGFYFIEKELWPEASFCHLMSLEWQETEMAESELNYITQRTGKDINPDDYKDYALIFEKNGYPLYPDPLWYATALHVAQLAEKEDDYNLAASCYSLAYNLSAYEDLIAKIDECKKHL